MKYNAELAEAFGVQPSVDAPEPPRETVRVESLPDPPGTEVMQAGQARRTRSTEKVNIDEAVMNIFREEAEEIRIRLDRFGIKFTPAMQQDLTDHLFTLLALDQQGLLIGGGALVRR